MLIECPNQDLRIFNVDTLITGEVITSVEQLAGVERVYERNYSISVEKGQLFNWSDLEPKIIAALKAKLEGKNVQPVAD